MRENDVEMCISWIRSSKWHTFQIGKKMLATLFGIIDSIVVLLKQSSFFKHKTKFLLVISKLFLV